MITTELADRDRRRFRSYTINVDSCKGCSMCIRVCPTKAITLVNRKAVLDPAACTACDVCVDACKFDAISKTTTEPFIP